jgi:hypothetical protein
MSMSDLITLDLNEIRQKFNLSQRAYNICWYNNLHNSNDILSWYEQYKGFLNLRNSGAKTNIELIKISEVLIKNIKGNLTNNPSSISKHVIFMNTCFKEYFDSLSNQEYIDIKLQDNELGSLEKYQILKTFIEEHNQNSSELKIELVRLFTLIETTEIYNDNYFLFDFGKLKVVFEAAKFLRIEHMFLDEVSKLRNRSKNVLKETIGGNLNVYLFNSWLTNRIPFSSLKNSGAATNEELNLFAIRISGNILKILFKKQSQQEIFFFNNFKEINYNTNEIKIQSEEIESEKIDFTLFIINNKNHFFSARILDSIQLSKDELSKKYGVTNERARQLKSEGEKSFCKKCNEIFNSSKDGVFVTNLLRDTMYSLSEIQKRLNDHENFELFKVMLELNLIPEFSKLDIKKWLQDELKLTYNLIGSRFYANETIIYNNSINWKQRLNDLSISLLPVLTKKKYILKLSINNMMQEELIFLHKIIKEQIGVTKVNDFWYLFNFDNIAYCQLALLFFGRPTELDQIYTYIIQNEDILESPVKNSIRSTLINNKRIFFSQGKTSTYGLNEFLNESNIGTKTIKEECYDILKSKGFPLHFEQLFKIIYNKRPISNVKSVQTIISQESKTFDFDQGFVWLKNSEITFTRPINHKSAFEKLETLIRQFQLDSHWVSKSIMMREISKFMPEYQGYYIIEKKMSEWGEKVTVPYFKDFELILGFLIKDEKFIQFMATNYLTLLPEKKNKFKTNLKKFLADNLNIELNQQVVNKSLTYFLN